MAMQGPGQRLSYPQDFQGISKGCISFWNMMQIHQMKQQVLLPPGMRTHTGHHSEVHLTQNICAQIPPLHSLDHPASHLSLSK